MEKEERIERYGEAVYEAHLQQCRDWHAAHREECSTKSKIWQEANPDKVKAFSHELNHKGGKRYAAKLRYMVTGIPGERHKIRKNHARMYHIIKQATPNSVFHHEWMPGTAKYRGLALVEKEAHQHGIIKVIKVLEGKITLLTEKEVKGVY